MRANRDLRLLIGKSVSYFLDYEFLRFILVGLVNTLFGYFVFYTAYVLFDFSAVFANAIGYALALILSFFLNRFFVFTGSRVTTKTFARFLVSFLISFLINLLVLIVGVEVLTIRAELAQVFAMVCYTCAFFILNKFFTFPSR